MKSITPVHLGQLEAAEEHVEAFKALAHLSRLQIFFRVIIPAIFPYLITGMRLGTGYAWRALIAAEMLAASSFGLGFMIYDASEYMSTNVIYAGIVLIAVLGYLLENVLIGRLEAATTEKWGVQSER